MGCLASHRWRIFLVAWMAYSAHFTTNVVREHYPAFSLADHGTFRVDGYEGFHPDIFIHHDGHAVINNQVFVPALAAIPLFVFRPALDALERYRTGASGDTSASDREYRTDKPMRQAFFRLVSDRGLDLRFGAATLITSAFFMAPLTALFLVFFYQVLRERGIGRGQASCLGLLLGFGTPIFYRTAGLNHNLFVMYGLFTAFALLWAQPGAAFPVSFRRRVIAGLFAGITVASDYIGVVILPVLYGYLVLSRLPTASWKTSLRESLAMVVGSLPPVLFLLYSQWAMYGNPFLPGQYWMPDQNVYVSQGLRGFLWPSPDLFLQNLFDPAFGLYTWGPLLLLSLVPAFQYRPDALILPRRERRFVWAIFLAVLLFSSANQYARLQFNSGVRYLIPVVPLLFLALVDHWIRLPRWARVTLGAFALLHSWVLTVFREPVPQAWRLFLAEGPQLPWFRVLRMTSSPDNPWLTTPLVPTALLSIILLVAVALWWWGEGIAATARPAHDAGARS
jgi:hypothetical protein